MYPVRLGYVVAVGRVRRLLKHGHKAEGLVTAVFTLEKTLRRTLRQLVVSAGFKSTIADKVISNLRSLEAVKNSWEIFDPKHRKLTSIVSPTDWATFKASAEMRNKLVHGERVFPLDVCDKSARDTLAALDRLRAVLDKEYDYSGWSVASRRAKSKLHIDPKVRIVP